MEALVERVPSRYDGGRAYKVIYKSQTGSCRLITVSNPEKNGLMYIFDNVTFFGCSYLLITVVYLY